YVISLANPLTRHHSSNLRVFHILTNLFTLSVLTRNQVEGCILHSVFVHSINALSKLYLISARPPQNGQGFNNITRHHSLPLITFLISSVPQMIADTINKVSFLNTALFIFKSASMFL